MMTALLGLMLAIGGSSAVAAQPFALELTLGQSDGTFGSAADWGWWTPGAYQGWVAEADDAIDLAEGRMTIPGRQYSMFLAMERTPEIRATGSSDSGQLVVSMDIEAYDLAFVEHYDLVGGGRLSPWLGGTHLRIDEMRLVPTGDGSAAAEEAKSRLWGVSAGVDLAFPIGDRTSVGARLVGRWASGQRETRTLPAGGAGARVSASDSTNRSMLGGELGVAWSATQILELEGGWRIRDWRIDNGPVSLDGPFLRVRLEL